ncbi:MAG: DUF1549 domain-containing protein [Pirellulales bacterium]
MSCVRVFVCALAAVISAIPAVTSAAESTTFVILPGNFTLHGPACRQRLVVEERRGEQFVGPASQAFGILVDGKVQTGVTVTPQAPDKLVPFSNVTLKSSDEKIVRIDGETAVPVGDGTATIEGTVLLGTIGKSLAVPIEPITVRVVDMQKPFQWSFRNHVESVMLKTGCTTGPCHGAQAGKGGFKLSLRGYDPEGDFTALTRQARGRRITPTDPGRSLILTKPTGAVPHKGGLRFRVDSLEYKVISEWIAAGTPAPKPDDARIERIEILPHNVTLKKAAEQQLIVLAHFSDGRTEDVTRWTLFTSANESAVQVDQTGLAKTVGYGEGAVTAWYLSKVTTSSISVPLETPISADVFTKSPRRNFIDELALGKLQSLGIKPSPECSDGEFIRRVYLDTLGILPTMAETNAFLADKSADKQQQADRRRPRSPRVRRLLGV